MFHHAKIFLALGALGAALAVALGAAGAHGLKPQLAANDPGGLFALALQYHQFHALGLLLLGLVAWRFPASRWFAAAGWLMLSGLLLFSGNLYLRSLLGYNALHALTPIGGTAFIFAWLLCAVGAARLPSP